MWIVAAIGSAFFAGVTSILAKLGINKTDSDVATAIRTIVVLVFSWLMAAITGQIGAIVGVTAESWAFLALSGIATGASWICYFKALSMGDVNKVVPIDKTSSVLTILLAIVLFGEDSNLPVKLIGSAAILVGTLLMVQHKAGAEDDATTAKGHTYLAYAVASAVFAALTSILAKVGIAGVPSNLATAIRTCFVLVMAWLVVGMRGKLDQVSPRVLDAKELGFICLSGIATGASWLCYYFAIQNGQVSVVVPIDKLSILVSMAFAAVVFHERYTKRSLLGLAIITVATVAMAVWS
jgi:transporter family protein